MTELARTAGLLALFPLRYYALPALEVARGFTE
jgi:hypothetical protein